MTKKHQNDSAEPKIGPKQHQNDPWSAQKRPQEEPKTTKKSRTTRRQENRTKTISRPSWIGPKGPNPRIRSPLGCHLGGQIGTKTDKKDAKTKRKFKSQKNRSKTILDPSWSDLGPSWAPSWADLDLKIVLSPRAGLVFLKNHFFDVKTVRRRLWDQLWPTKAPK